MSRSKPDRRHPRHHFRAASHASAHAAQEQNPAANVFDTQVAAGMIGLAYPSGLSKLVRELVGVRLGKGFTFTHWDQRPLTAVQIRYAADDVRYLPALRESIGQKLDVLGHMRW